MGLNVGEGEIKEERADAGGVREPGDEEPARLAKRRRCRQDTHGRNLVKRLILFDIDGTLLATDGAGRRAFERCLRALFGRTGPIGGYDFHGKTDPQIVYDLLGHEGIARAEVEAALPAFWGAYGSALAEELEVSREKGGVRLLPGVRALLDCLGTRGDVMLALLTGNVEAGARLKLGAAGLDGRFRFGAYGSDSAVRTELPAVAFRRAREHTGIEFAGRDAVIIGDTPDDVACARVSGALGVAVATGRHGVAALRAAGADVVLDNLLDLDLAVQVLCDGERTSRAL